MPPGGTRGGGTEPEAKIRGTRIDGAGTAAAMRLDEDNGTGHRFTVFLNLIKFDGQWKVVNKSFYLYP